MIAEIWDVQTRAQGTFQGALRILLPIGRKWAPGVITSVTEVRACGPLRAKRAEACRDIRELSDAYREAGAAGAHNKQHLLQSHSWTPSHIEADETSEFCPEEKLPTQDTKPRGVGWSRIGDANWFRHAQAHMMFDCASGLYFKQGSSGPFVACKPPHNPIQHSVDVLAGSCVADSSNDRVVRLLMLDDLLRTGTALKQPLHFLDSPAACYALFAGIRNGQASDWCARHLHTLLFPALSKRIQDWEDAELTCLACDMCEALDDALLQTSACYGGCSLGMIIVLGCRVLIVTLGAIRVFVEDIKGWREHGNSHSVSSLKERAECEERGGQVMQGPEVVVNGSSSPSRELYIFKAIHKQRECIQIERNTDAEVDRILHRSPDCFCVLGLTHLDDLTLPTVRSRYRKVALQIHPDKVSESLKPEAKLAFEKVETSVRQVEQYCAMDPNGVLILLRVLSLVGKSTITPSCARLALGVSDSSTTVEVETTATGMRNILSRLGFSAEIALGMMCIDEAVEILSSPVASNSEMSHSRTGLQVTRALGLRDFKRPKAILSIEPQASVIHVQQGAACDVTRLVLVSDPTSCLSLGDVAKRSSQYPDRSKVISSLLVKDISSRVDNSQRRLAACLSCCVRLAKPSSDSNLSTKKRKLETVTPRVRCRHILIKYADVRAAPDKDAYLRTESESRSLAEAEILAVELIEQLAASLDVFPDLVRKVSECKSAQLPGQRAGDLGWLCRGECSPRIDRVAFSLEVGEVSDIIITGRGLHIIHRVA